MVRYSIGDVGFFLSLGLAMTEKVTFLPLEKALSSLESALAQPKDEFTRDASIQRFEYTFELLWKTLKRYLFLEANIDEFRIRNLFREAAKLGLIENVTAWFAYLNARNITSHTYNLKAAEEVYEAAQSFVVDARRLLDHLKSE
jgi:nucleotidyltransferase substrate binding protein (TIGR01987 family)